MKIHFVWIGKNQGAHCTATPLAVAQVCPQDEVWLWVMKANAAEFTTPLKGSKVQIMLLDSAVGPLGAEDWVKEAFGVITTLQHYKAWAAAKDLAVLLSLYKYGGLYMDTTCMLATDAETKKYASMAGGKARSFADAVKVLAKSGPMLPLVTKETIDHQPECFTPKAITVGYDGSDEKTHPIIRLPQVDVWAYFSPAGHKIFLGAIESYSKRAKIIGLDSKDSTIPIGKDELAGRYRNDVIGRLITHSVYDGLLNGGVKADAIKQHTWPCAQFTDVPANLPQGGDGKIRADIVPDLGIIKQYKGSWR